VSFVTQKERITKEPKTTKQTKHTPRLQLKTTNLQDGKPLEKVGDTSAAIDVGITLYQFSSSAEVQPPATNKAPRDGYYHHYGTIRDRRQRDGKGQQR